MVGAGPAGSSTAFYLATAGLDVLVLEKSHFPREKVCGDGLAPRAVKALTGMGVPLAGERRLGYATRACGSSAAAAGSS